MMNRTNTIRPKPRFIPPRSVVASNLPPVNRGQLRPRSAWDELREQAVMAFQSGLLPKGVDTPQKAVTIAMMGKELGLSVMQSLCGIYVVNGMQAMRGSLMLRLIYERVPGAHIHVTTPPEKANEECVVEMKRPSGKAQLFRFNIEDAKRAGFWSKPVWQQHTATMLRWAAIRTGARVVFADAIAGCYMEDELPGEVAIESEVSPPLRNRDMKVPTDGQVQRLNAIAQDKNWTDEALSIWTWNLYKKKTVRELNLVEFDKLFRFIQSAPAKFSAEEEIQQQENKL